MEGDWSSLRPNACLPIGGKEQNFPFEGFFRTYNSIVLEKADKEIFPCLLQTLDFAVDLSKHNTVIANGKLQTAR